MVITILDESGPAPMPNIYRSGPVVSEEAPANKRPRSFRTFRSSLLGIGHRLPRPTKIAEAKGIYLDS